MQVRTSYRAALRYCSVLLSIGCVTPLPPPTVAPLKMTTTADPGAYAAYMGRGTATINGQAFLTTRGGDVKLGAGRAVTLDPLTPYALEWYRQTAGDLARFGDLPPDSLFRKARRSSVVDAQGHFRFATLPKGTYLVRSTVTWETGAAYSGLQGGVVADTVSIAEGETRDIILNQVVGVAEAKGVPFPILTRDEVSARKFTSVGKVTGISCKRAALTDPDPTEQGARDDLAMNARKLKADAATNVVCEKGGLSFRHNCVSYIICTGDAITWS